MYDGHMLGYGGGFMWIFLLILLVLVIIWALKTVVPGGNQRAGRPSALEILEACYVRGEIDRDEFEVKRKDLLG